MIFHQHLLTLTSVRTISLGDLELGSAAIAETVLVSNLACMVEV
jgi:hypothetical protein